MKKILVLFGFAAILLVGFQFGRYLREREKSASSGKVAVKAVVSQYYVVSEDGRRCTVPPDEYERLKIGDAVTCVWESGK